LNAKSVEEHMQQFQLDDNLALIKQQNDHIAQLTAKINEHEKENKKN
jgi:hypothetical protein